MGKLIVAKLIVGKLCVGWFNINRQIMTQLGFKKELELFDNGYCPFCKERIIVSDFNDSESIKEFNISGLCQKCQNEFFSENPKDSFRTEHRKTYIVASRTKSNLVTY